MSQTAQNIIDDVKEDYLNMPTTDTTTYTNAQFLRLINKGLTDLGFWTDAQLNQITVTTSDGTQSYALGATGVNPVAVEYVYISGKSPMRETTLEKCAQDAALTTKGEPTEYLFTSSDITGSLTAEAALRFSPIPNGAYTVVVGVVTQPKKVTATGDTIYLDPVYTDALKAQVAKYIALRTSNAELVAICEGEIERGKNNVRLLERSKANRAYLSETDEGPRKPWPRSDRSY